MLDIEVYCGGRSDGQRARAEVAKKDVQLTQLQAQVRHTRKWGHGGRLQNEDLLAPFCLGLPFSLVDCTYPPLSVRGTMCRSIFGVELVSTIFVLI